MMFRRILCALLALGMLFAVTGCQGGEQPNWKPSSELNLDMVVFENSRGSYMRDHLQPAIDRFKKLYPEVQVNITEYVVSGFYDDSYQKDLGVRWMAGEGPDILFINDHLMKNHDILKMEKGGSFEDLTEKLREEVDLDGGDYVKGVFDGTAFDGHNYIIPLGYTLPMFLTTEKNVAESGIDFAGSKDTVAIMTQLGDYWEREKDKENPGYTLCNPRPIYWLDHFAGLTYGDFHTGEVQMDFDVLRQLLDQWKRIKPYEIMEHPSPLKEEYPENLTHIDLNNAFESGTLTCTLGSVWGYREYLDETQLIDSELSPQFYPLRNMDGGITAQLESAVAIRRGSPNAQNAWNLIKIALSEEMQTAMQRNVTDRVIPVNRAAWRNYFNMANGDTFENIISGTTLTGEKFDVWLDPYTEEQHESFVKLQDEIDKVFIRFPLDQELLHKFDPYIEGTATFEACQKEAEYFLFIYLSE